jgi:GWxTD domain-containing protein
MEIRKNIFWIVYGLILLFLWACAPGTGGTETNRRIAIPPAQALVEASYALRTLNDSIEVFLQLEEKGQIAGFFAANARLAFTVEGESGEGNVIAYADTLLDFTQRMVTSEEHALLNFRLPLAQVSLPAILRIKIGTGPGLEEVRNMHIPLSRNLANKNYLLVDLETRQPLFRTFHKANEPFIIEGPDSLQVFSLKKFEASFEPALPPMAAPAAPPPRTIPLLHTYRSYANDTVFLPESGLYLIQPEDENRGGEGLLVEDGAFPQLSTADDLIRPLIYLTSSQERDQLYKASDPKLAVDEFWLELAGDKTVARSLIRLYYGRVTEANRRYSSHKAGWLTDRGMIFIIFGQPQVLQRLPDREEWYYERGLSSGGVRFVFNKKPNVFTHNHYELVRSKSLEPYWYTAVDRWRRGTITP